MTGQKDKEYIFLTHDIANIGGLQLYIRAKTEWLLERGWDVRIFHSIGGRILIEDFNNYEHYYVPELFEPAYFYWKRKRGKIQCGLLDKISGNYQKIIFESHSVGHATWGEMLAERLNAKNFIYIIDEKPSINPAELAFMRYKYERREVAGIVKETVPNAFRTAGFDVSQDGPLMPAYHCNDCVLDVAFTPFVKRKGYTIGLFGRLEKEYMRYTADDIVAFLDRHKEDHFNVIYVGGERDGNTIKEELERKYNDIHHADVYFTGFMFPLPRRLVNEFDVCIAGAGASWAITREGVPTITVDPNDNLSSGVLSVTTMNSIFSDGTKDKVESWLEKVYQTHDAYIPHYKSVADSYEKHFEMIDGSEQSKQYDTSFLEAKGAYLTVQRLVCSLFSGKMVKRVLEIKSKITKHD